MDHRYIRVSVVRSHLRLLRLEEGGAGSAVPRMEMPSHAGIARPRYCYRRKIHPHLSPLHTTATIKTPNVNFILKMPKQE